MRENKQLEFKSDITNQFLKTVSAFANYNGGKIMFGVDDNGKAIGIKNPNKVCLDIENKINDSIIPKPDYNIQINKNNNVITLIVHEGDFKPYLYKTKAYKRNDTSTIEIDHIELKRLLIESENLTFDELTAKRQNLDFTELRQQLEANVGIKNMSTDVLRTLGFFDNKGKYNNAAELLADVNGFPGIDIARFGENIDIILDRETITNISVLKQYRQAITIFKKYYQYEIVKSIKREVVEKIPEKAFREAVANAIVHRTWDVNAHIKIAMFADRIEITSVGGLPNNVTEENYLSGRVSILRNPIIGDVFFRLHYIERFGTGIKRIKNAYSQYFEKPIFNIGENYIQIILPVTGMQNLSGDFENVYKLMHEGKLVTSSDVAQAIDCGKSKATSILNQLVSKGLITKIGNGRSVKYSIK